VLQKQVAAPSRRLLLGLAVGLRLARWQRSVRVVRCAPPRLLNRCSSPNVHFHTMYFFTPTRDGAALSQTRVDRSTRYACARVTPPGYIGSGGASRSRSPARCHT
jgi:hypothetical protein